MIIISRYTDRCDLGDTVEIFGVDNILSKYKIYISDCIVPLKIDSEKELLPFYPYIVAIMVSNKEEGGTIRLSSKSYIDEQEEEWLTWDLDYAKKYWAKCKRDKKTFDEEECLKKMSWLNVQEYHKQIVDRVKAFGKKATIDGIHTPYHDRCRQKLYEDMIKVGWKDNVAYPWCFGWDRYLDKIKKE